MAEAIQLLPPEIRPYFEKYRAEIVEHSDRPGPVADGGLARDSPPRHFLDMDVVRCCIHSRDLPHGYDDAVRRDGAETVVKNGTLPWRADDILS